MEKILEQLEKMDKLSLRNKEYSLDIENLNNGRNELEELNKKLKLTLLGSYDRTLAQKEFDDKKKELEDIEKLISESNKKRLDEFETQKSKVISAINEKISKYIRKEELDDLKLRKISQKNAYSKMVENSKKDIEKIITEINEGKNVDISRLQSARGELKENSKRIEEIGRELQELEEYQSIEENRKVVSDLNYLKMRVQGMDFDTMKDIKEDEFFKEYGKDKDTLILNLDENNQDRNEENRDEENKNEENKNQVTRDEKIVNEKNTIILAVDENKIDINKSHDLFYKEETKNKKELIEEYGIKSYFITDKKQQKNIDYSLISALQRIDNKENTLVEAYLNVIKGGGLSGKSLEESIQILNKSVNIVYKFNKESVFFVHYMAKKIARNASKLGIATLEGISEKGFFDKIKDKFSKLKNVKLLKGKEKQKTLGIGEKTNAQKDIERVKELISIDRERYGKETKDTYEDFYSKYEANNQVKKNMDDIVNNYKEQEKKAQENRAKDVAKIQKLISDESEESMIDK